MSEKIIGTKQAAEILGVSVSTIYRMIEQGLLAPTKTPGGQRRFDMTQLSNFKENSRAIIAPQNPSKNKYIVACSSMDKGSEMKNTCTVGCIGCKMCEKACPSEAISVEDNIAKINYEKCTLCGACEEKCPKKIIKIF